MFADARRPTILVVEDNPHMRASVVDLLMNAGMNVIAVDNGGDALAWLRGGTRRPDLVLTDLTMPILDGWGLIAAIRRSRKLHDLPIVVMSAEASLAMIPDDVKVVRKPFAADDLLEAIRAATALGSTG